MQTLEMSDKLNLSITLTSPITKLILPVHIQNVKYMMLRGLRYITASANQKRMLISFGKYNSESYYYDGQTYSPYFRMLRLPNTSGSHLSYVNTQQELFDVKLPAVETITKLDIYVYIDGALATDISPSNPLDLEITFIKN